jgi:hypothetical protein
VAGGAGRYLTGRRVVRELERLATERARPETVVRNNGTELTSRAVLRWATRRFGVTVHRAAQARPEHLRRGSSGTADSVPLDCKEIL